MGRKGPLSLGGAEVLTSQKFPGSRLHAFPSLVTPHGRDAPAL